MKRNRPTIDTLSVICTLDLPLMNGIRPLRGKTGQDSSPVNYQRSLYCWQMQLEAILPSTAMCLSRSVFTRSPGSRVSSRQGILAEPPFARLVGGGLSSDSDHSGSPSLVTWQAVSAIFQLPDFCLCTFAMEMPL
jgi:hypothetical protein